MGPSNVERLRSDHVGVDQFNTRLYRRLLHEADEYMMAFRTSRRNGGRMSRNVSTASKPSGSLNCDRRLFPRFLVPLVLSPVPCNQTSLPFRSCHCSCRREGEKKKKKENPPSMDLPARRWEPRSVYKRRRSRPFIAQRLGVMPDDVPTRSDRPPRLRLRKGKAKDDDKEDDDNDDDPPTTGKSRRQDDDPADDEKDPPQGKGKGEHKNCAERGYPPDRKWLYGKTTNNLYYIRPS